MADPGKVAAVGTLVDMGTGDGKVGATAAMVDIGMSNAKIGALAVLVDAYVGTERKAYCRIGKNNVFTGIVTT